MAASSSSLISTPPADNQGEGHPREAPLQPGAPGTKKTNMKSFGYEFLTSEPQSSDEDELVHQYPYIHTTSTA
ncbi:hypothetical protein TNCV_3723801 [Trichonephila clavipes]|nr:hypothetical protein TNCV_3723801 [Trichonephila clavipes]